MTTTTHDSKKRIFIPDPVLLDISELPVVDNTVVIITVCVKV